jgi:hypothetical protein
MKGILESIPEFMQVLVAIAIGIVLITITFEFFSSIQQSNRATISGTSSDLAKAVAQQVLSCWQNHRDGLDSQSAVCKIIQINSANNFSENDTLRYLNCNTIPDNVCPPNDCSSCISSNYADQDKIKWDVTTFPGNISISYSGDQRAIIISSLNP